MFNLREKTAGQECGREMPGRGSGLDLATISVTGFRRFKTKTTLQTNGKLVAILGPNEAGKSSLLKAIELLEDDSPPGAKEFCRAAEKSTFEIEGRFYLSDSDLEAAGLSGSRWLHVYKGEDGVRKYRLDPPAPKRDRAQRGEFVSAVTTLFGNKRFLSKLAELELTEQFEGEFKIIKGALDDKSEDLSKENIARVDEFIGKISPHIDERMAAVVKSIPTLGEALVKHESAQNPRMVAIGILAKRLPQIVVFGEQERNLQHEYDLAQVSSAKPIALDNLFDLAEVQLDKYVSILTEGDQAKISTLETKINRNLEKNFSAYWKQSKITVSIKGLVDRIIVHVVNEDAEFTSFAERSDGLRQFVALIAFANGAWSGNPIMLIDEAEQRLHYDAQADLVQMLGRQEIASKIVYTTHSAGCLPEDLGNGVHLVHPIKGDDAFSRINNTFWDDSTPGFTPLLFGMGASTMAFFPTRHALMVEGPSDMLLLPTMIRHALSLSVLGFQIVPGLSYSEGLVQSPAMGKKSGVLFLVDGDPGGEKLRENIVQMKVPKADVFVLTNPDKSAVEVEDFVAPDLLVMAFNALCKKFHKSEGQITLDALPESSRMAWLEGRYKEQFKKKISKIAFAYEVLDLINNNRERSLIDATRASAFKKICRQIYNRFANQKIDA